MTAAYRQWLRERAKAQGFDGCTGVLDIEVECCYEHDFAYRTGVDPRSYWIGRRDPISRAQADRRLRECYVRQGRPLLGLVRWLGVRLLGGRAWKGK